MVRLLGSDFDKSDKATKRKKVNAVLKSLQNGSTYEDACKAADVGVMTFWRWRRANKRLAQLCLQVTESRVTIVEDALFKAATDPVTPSVTAQMFFLTRRAAERWPDRNLIVNNVINNMMKAGKSADTGFNGADAAAERTLIEYLRNASK